MKKEQKNRLVAKAWNPFTGCTKMSPACKNCYAEPMAEKLHRWGTAGYDNIFKFTIHQDRISKSDPLHRKKPTLYFINNMSDTFHEDADIKSIDKIINIASMAFWHNFYFLTKRSERMKEYFKDKDIPDNFWLGVTVEDKKHGLPRLKDLQEINCKNKHICCEPLLEDLGEFDLSGISLVVGGGESGKNARRCEPSWVESLKEQCNNQNVHFYWKQWGTFGEDGVRRSKDKNGCLINGKEYLSFPDNIMPEN
jgi:protein gp37